MKLRSKWVAGFFSWALCIAAAGMMAGPVPSEGSTPPLSEDAASNEQNELLEELFQLGGFNDLFEHRDSAFVENGTLPDTEVPQGDLELAVNFVRRVYQAGEFRDTVKERLVKSYNRGHMETLLNWYRSPLGMKITLLETEALRMNPAEKMTVGKKYVKENPLNASRKALLGKLDKLIEITDVSVATIQSYLRILAADNPRYQGQSVDSLMVSLGKKIEPHIRQAVQEVSAYTYRDLTDQELETYYNVLAGKAGSWLIKAYLAGSREAWSQVVLRAKDFQSRLYTQVESKGEYQLLRDFAPPGRRYALIRKRDPFMPLVIDGEIQVTQKKKEASEAPKVAKYTKGYGREFRNTPNIPEPIFRKIEKDDPELFSDLEFYAKLFNNRSKLKEMSNKDYQSAVKKYKGLIEQANGTKLLPTPLQANYGSLKLVGVIWKGSERVALVEIQGNKGHTVKKGVLIGPKYGVVDSIQRDEIVVKENSRDYLGNIVTKKKEIEFSAQSQE